MDRPSNSKNLRVRDKDFEERMNRMLRDIGSDCDESDSESDVIDDSDEDPDFILENERCAESDSDEAENEDALLDNESATDDTEEMEDVVTEMPEYIFGRLKKGEFGPAYWWTTNEPVRNVRTPARNIIRGGLPGLTRPARSLGDNPSKSSVWNLLFDAEMVETIVTYTNQKIETVRNGLSAQTSKSNYRNTDAVEIKAYIGLQLLSSILKNSREDMTSLFSKDVTNRPYFNATMSVKRYQILNSCLRFDDTETRAERKRQDKAAHISEIFGKFISNSQTNYSLTEHLTVDEMLVPFRGRCPFKVYMPLKPYKYGVKVQCLCDAKTSYLYNAYIYTGKDSDGTGLPANELALQKPTQTLVRLCKPVERTNRNITCDNYFSSIEAVDVLNKKGLTLVGTMRKNKLVIPHELLADRERPVGSSLHCFNNSTTLVSFVPKRNKAVVLISSMHHTKEINEAKKKPEIVCFYNDTKCGVDIMDMKCAVYASNRRTRRWPQAIFNRILNVCGVNAYILYLCFKDSPMKSRFHFLKDLSQELIEPHMLRRLEIPNLIRDTRAEIMKALGGKAPQQPQLEGVPDDKMQKRKTCSKCPSQKKRKTAYACIKCKNSICLECSRKVCTSCAVDFLQH